MTHRSHHRVEAVNLELDRATLALTPTTWFKDHPTETIEVDGETVPKQVECDPTDDGAAPDDPGHRHPRRREIEVDVDADTDLRPGDHITLTVHRSRAAGASPTVGMASAEAS